MDDREVGFVVVIVLTVVEVWVYFTILLIQKL